MGFIEVDINFFIGLKIISQTLHEIQDDFSLTKVESDGTQFIIDSKEWKEVQSELRIIQIDKILKQKP
jgi:hypothetical protein